MFTNKTNYPMALLYIDHYGKLQSPTGEMNIFSHVGTISLRFVWLIPVKATKSDTVVQALEGNIYRYLD